MSTAYEMPRRQRRVRWTPLRILLLVLSVSALLVIALWLLVTGWHPSQDRYPLQGVLVSEASGPIDWARLAARDGDFAYIRSSAGNAHRDAQFAANWRGAAAVGLRYGAVHDFSLCRLASDQARLFISTVPRDNAALPPAVSIDFTPDCTARPSRDLVLAELNTLLVQMEAHTGKPAILRVSPAFEAQYDVASGINRTLWLDRNFLPPSYAARPWVMWSATQYRRIAGADNPLTWLVVQP